MTQERDMFSIELPTPRGWRPSAFGEVIEKLSTNKKKLKESEYQQSGPYPVIDQGQQFISGYTNRIDCLVEPGSGCVIFGDHTKTVKLFDRPFAPGADGLKVLKPKESVLPKFLYYMTTHLAQALPSKGYARHFQYIENSQVAIPSLEIQSKIVAKLDILGAEIASGSDVLNDVRKNLELYKQSVLNGAIQGKLVPQDTNDELASKLLQRIRAEKEKLIQAGKLKKEKPLPPIDPSDVPFELPKGWEWVRLGDLIVDGPTNGLYLPQSAYGSGVPILRIDDFQQDWCRAANDLRKVNASTADRCKYALTAGDIVVNRVNSMTHLGKCTVITAESAPSIFESNMMKFRLHGNVLPDFVVCWLQSILGRSLLIGNAKQAVNQASINQQDIRSTLVPLPPIRVQRGIAELVESSQNSQKELSAGLTELETKSGFLRQSILKSAFEGRLT